MLDRTFIETADYRTLVESVNHAIVVGRRGTGKSALAHRLKRHWQTVENMHVRSISPEDYQTLALRPASGHFGNRFNLIRAGMKIAWRYALIMEATAALAPTYRFPRDDKYRPLAARSRAWTAAGRDTSDRLAEILRQSTDMSIAPEARIGALAANLEVKDMEELLMEACDALPSGIVFLADRLDEGYEPDDIGTGIVDGLIQAAIDIRTNIPAIRPYIFLRDNIFRSVRNLDPDYSRNIEGTVLRLHWDEQHLLDFATRRMKLVFDVDEEATQRVWNSCTTGILRGRPGFRKMLRLTLYRPRDLLLLLNETFRLASGGSVSIDHARQASQQISNDRLEDLLKEYGAIIPSLKALISTFEGVKPELRKDDATTLISDEVANSEQPTIIRQDMEILGSPATAIDVLVSVGFLGVYDRIHGRFVFRHDGRGRPDLEAIERVLVHPCYWIALRCADETVPISGDVEDIYDEYDIGVPSTEASAIREAQIEEIVTEVNRIPAGPEGADDFEKWCAKAIRICFARGLVNVERHPNKNALNRRDIVGTNREDGSVWRRIHADYGVRQVVFEVKNYAGLTADDYRQVCSYLGGEYGRLGFIVTRDTEVNLRKGRDLDWVREMYFGDGKYLVVKITAAYLCALLRKLKRPVRHDRVNDALSKLLDTYVRLYLSGQTEAADHRPSPGRKSRKSKKRARPMPRD